MALAVLAARRNATPSCAPEFWLAKDDQWTRSNVAKPGSGSLTPARAPICSAGWARGEAGRGLRQVRGGRRYDYGSHGIGSDSAITDVALGGEEPGSLAGPDIAWGEGS
jgi:hypothetical protein